MNKVFVFIIMIVASLQSCAQNTIPHQGSVIRTKSAKISGGEITTRVDSVDLIQKYKLEPYCKVDGSQYTYEGRVVWVKKFTGTDKVVYYKMGVIVYKEGKWKIKYL
jgi:hypothetical protein